MREMARPRCYLLHDNCFTCRFTSILSVDVLIRLSVVAFHAEHYLSMSKDKKRELYACGSNYVTLDEVDTWRKQMAEQSGRCKYPSGNHRNHMISTRSLCYDEAAYYYQFYC